jgi:hypothetical protein
MARVEQPRREHEPVTRRTSGSTLRDGGAQILPSPASGLPLVPRRDSAVGRTVRRSPPCRAVVRLRATSCFQEPFQRLELAANVATYTMPQRRTKYPRELLTLEITDLREVCPLPPRARCGIPVRRLERDRPPGPLDASRQTSGIELAQGFPQFALRDLKPVKQVLDRAPRGYGGKTLVHVSPLPRLDIQSGCVGSWRHGAFLSGGAARRHVGNRPEGALTASSGFADAPWNRNRPRISGRGTKPPNVLNDTSHPGGTGVDPAPGVPRFSVRSAVVLA